MKKIKGLLVAFVALFVFTLAMVKVSATTINEVYTFNLEDVGTSGIAQGSTASITAASSANPSRTLSLTIKPQTVSGSTRWKADGFLEVQAKVDNFSEIFEVTTEGTASITFGLNTGGNSKKINVSVDSGSATEAANGSNSKDFTYTLTGSGKHTIEFSSSTAPGSNVKIYSIVVNYSYETNESPVDLAVAAIDAIGTVSYTDESRGLIAAATSALTGLDTAEVSNYATYTAAVAAFNSLAAEKKDAFTAAVTAIGTVTPNSLTAIENADAKLDDLLETEKTAVSSAIATLNQAKATYYDVAYDTFAKVLSADQLSGSLTFDGPTQLGSTIFKAYSGVTTEELTETATIQNGTEFTKRIKLNGTGAVSGESSTRALGFTAKKAGTLKIACVSGSNTEVRTLNVNREATKVTTISAVKTSSEVEINEVSITEAGNYYLTSAGSGINIFYIEFVPEADPEPSVTFYQQSGYNADGVELVRYIGIVENVAEADIPGSFSLVITGANIPGGSFDATSLCVIANRITSNGETYVAEINGANYEFGVKNNVLYVVCVLAVSNDGAALAEQYKETELTATLTVNGNQVGVKTYTVLGAQA